MRLKLVSLIFPVLLFCSSAAADVIVYAGENTTNDANWQYWWNCNNGGVCPNTPLTNMSFRDTNYFPHSGSKCGKIVINGNINNSQGGAQIRDPNWAGIPVANLTNISFWMRSEPAGLVIDVQFFTTAAPNQLLHVIITNTGTWKNYSYPRVYITNMMPDGVNMLKFEGVEFSQVYGSAGTFYVDDVVIRGVGAAGLPILDGETASSHWTNSPVTNLPHPVWYGEILLTNVAIPKRSGGYCAEIISSTGAPGLHQQALVPNQSWSPVDASKYVGLEGYVRGKVGGESVTIYLRGGAGLSKPIILGPLSTNWQSFVVKLSELTNTVFDPSQWVETDFYMAGGQTIYVDDMKWSDSGALSIGGCTATPSTVTNNVQRTIVFRAKARSYGMAGSPRAVASVKIDLTPLGGPYGALMTNVSSIDYRYAFTFSTNAPVLAGGGRTIPMWASDVEFVEYDSAIVTVMNGIKPTIDAAEADPDQVTNQWSNPVAFHVETFSKLTNIKSVYLDLALIGGSRVLMSNVSGTSDYYYNGTVPAGTRGGWKSLVTTVSDFMYGVNTGSIPLFVASYPKVKNFTALPGIILNNTVNNMVFSVRAKSDYTNIAGVSLDLTPFGASLVQMTNISGATSWRYTYALPAGLAGGDKTFAAVISDGAGRTTNVTFGVLVVDRTPPQAPVIVTLASNLNHSLLTWTHAVEETGISNYLVVRGDFSGYYTYTNRFANDVTNWIDTNAPAGLKWGEDYYYRVFAVDKSSNVGVLSAERGIHMPQTFVFYDGELPATAFQPAAMSSYDGGTTVFLEDSSKVHSGVNSLEFTGSLGALYVPFYYNPVNIDGFNKLSFWIKGTTGSENLKFVPYFGGSSTWGGETDIVLSDTNWTHVEITLDHMTNSATASYWGALLSPSIVDPKYFQGIEVWDNTFSGSTFYFDDMVFMKGSVAILSADTLNSVISNDRDTPAIFEISGSSTVGSMASGLADMRQLGGTNETVLTNLSGSTGFRSLFTVAPGLTAGVKYIPITIRDSFGNTASQLITITVVDKNPPLAVTNVQGHPGNGRAFLSWTPGTDETGISGYRVYNGTARDSLTSSNTFGNITTATIPNAVNDTLNYYAVRAIDSSGNLGPLSTIVSNYPHPIFLPTFSFHKTTFPFTVYGTITNNAARSGTISVIASSAYGNFTNASLDLTPIGGPLTNYPETYFTNGHTYAWSPLNWIFGFTVPAGLPEGVYNLNLRLADETGDEISTNISLTIAPAILFHRAEVLPGSINNGDQTTIVFDVAVEAIGSMISSVTLVSPIPGVKVLMTNITAGTSWRFGFEVLPSYKLPAGNFPLLVRAVTTNNKTASTTISLAVNDTLPPTQVQNFAATYSPSTGIHLTWTSATDESQLTNYRIFRKTASESNFVMFASVLRTLTSYISTSSFTPNSTNFYMIEAWDASGNSSSSAQIWVTNGSAPVTADAAKTHVRDNSITPGSTARPVIHVELVEDASVAIDIFNPFGELIKSFESVELVRGVYDLPQPPGYWDLTDSKGHEVPTGVYVIRILIEGLKPMYEKVMVVR